MVFDIPSMSWHELQRHIYPEVVPAAAGETEKFPEITDYPEDFFYLSIASIKVAFIIEFKDLAGAYQRQAVALSDLDRWRISAADFCDAIGRDGSVIRVDQWDRVYGAEKVFQPPSFDRDWTYYLLRPQELQSLDIDGRPLIMIPAPEMVIVTGERDRRGRRAMMRESRGVAKNPLTPRPLLFDGRVWQEF